MFGYCLTYLILTSLQIYVMTYEYFNILSKPMESRASISLISLAHHSLWNLIALIIHFIIGFQMFTAFKQYLWLVIGSLAVCHFSV